MYKRILVAIDDSSTSAKALDEAINLAKGLGATLCVAHAVDEGMLAQHALGIGTYIDADKVKGEMRDAANRLVDDGVAKAAAAGITADRRLIESERRRTAQQISDAAAEWQADLIVVGTHGRRGVDRMLVGSVAENLVRIASTSLMLVREK